MAAERRSAALQAAIAAGILSQDDDEGSSAILMDLDLVKATAGAMQAAPFPPGTLHAFAVKANPVGRLLQLMRDMGLGAEVASLGELRQALGCGFAPGGVVFDSPIKTRQELGFALRAGVRLNLDNFQELERVAAVVEADPSLLRPTPDGATRLIGLRINPQVGEGSIAALSTAGKVSKFGIPLTESRGELLAAFRRHPWLNALHLHVGSQGVPLELTVEGVARVAELAREVEAAEPAAEVAEEASPAPAAAEAAAAGDAGSGGGGAAGRRPRRILAFDIGGGLPVQYGNDDLAWLLGAEAAREFGLASSRVPAEDTGGAEPSCGAAECGGGGGGSIGGGGGGIGGGGGSVFATYAGLLRRRLPWLWEEGAPQLVTEFGRCVVAKAAFAAGRVEYVKSAGGRRVVVCPLGADLLLRAVYLPATWPARVELAAADGAPLRARGPSGPGPGPGPGPGGASPAASSSEARGGPGQREAEGAGTEAGAGESADLIPTDVVGPLCFQGDKLAEAAPLPGCVRPGDWVVVADVGAYTLSMYSRYNSRCSPGVWGFSHSHGSRGEGGAEAGGEGGGGGEAGGESGAWAEGLEAREARGVRFVRMRRGEGVEEVMGFWNMV